LIFKRVTTTGFKSSKNYLKRRQNMELENKLKEFINIILEKKENDPIKKIDRNLSLREDLGFDSLDLAELTVRIEDEYNIDVFEDGIVDKVGEIIDKLTKRGEV
jgi:acyl carrier protein